MTVVLEMGLQGDNSPIVHVGLQDQAYILLLDLHALQLPKPQNLSTTRVYEKCIKWEVFVEPSALC